MKINFDAFVNIDRRIVFVVVFLTLLIPMLWPYAMPCKPVRDVKEMYNAIEQAAANHTPVLLSFEFDPTGAAEQEPMARAVLRHLFARGGKAVIMNKSGGQLGEPLHLQIIEDCALEYNKEYGKDYIYLPYIPGSTNLVIGLGQSLASQWPKDYRGTDLSQIELIKDMNIARLADFEYVMVICASLTTVVDWITYGQSPYNLKMGFGVLGNTAPDCANYVNSGQIRGLLGGLIGPAQYEQMLYDNGIGLFRRFSSADLVSSKLPSLCAKLADPKRSGVAAYVWADLSPEEQKSIEAVASSGRDTLSPTVKRKLAGALNDVILQTDILPDAELAKTTVGPDIDKLLKKPDLAPYRPQILRRLAVESQFPAALAKSHGPGQAMRWMTPQSIAHVVLILAILFGNVCFFLDKARRKNQART